MQLESLHIQNYKLFQDLEIPKLGQVNLITGKNNTGKTILLEALRIWASEGDASVVNNIIWKRGDWDEGSELNTYKSLYRNKNLSSDILINYSTFSIHVQENKHITKIVFKPHFNELREVPVGNHIGNKEFPQDIAIFVPASIDFNNKSLWKDIVFNRKRKDIIKILKVIDDKITDVEIVENEAFIGLENIKNLVPLKNFGEGLNRLLIIAMALVSAEDNLLLIDEIDTGLHYSVQKQLWEIVFEFAKKLNTQVFATTHSEDCIKAFYSVSTRDEFDGMGKYFTLSRKRNSEEIIALEYEKEDLELALESNLETR